MCLNLHEAILIILTLNQKTASDVKGPVMLLRPPTNTSLVKAALFNLNVQRKHMTTSEHWQLARERGACTGIKLLMESEVRSNRQFIFSSAINISFYNL